MASQDIIARSATTTPMPSVRQVGEVAKLIDVSKCIGCKACQVACSEWNDLRDEVGQNHGTYDNPTDLTASSWTVMRFTEHEDESGKLEWLIRKDGCMHCAEPGCLAACPSPGAIIQYANGIVDFNQDKCIGCGYCITGCPFNIPRISQKDHKAYKCSLCSDRVAVGMEPACVKTCPTGAIVFGTKEAMKEHADGRIADLKSRGYDNAGLYDPTVSVAPRDVRAASRRPAVALCRPAERAEHQPAGVVVEGRDQAARSTGHGRHGADRVLPLHPRRAQPRGGGRACDR